MKYALLCIALPLLAYIFLLGLIEFKKDVQAIIDGFRKGWRR